MIRGYYVSGYDEEWGAACVAVSASQAKKIVFDTGFFLGDDWIEIKARWIRNADVTGLPIGIVEPLGEALQRGFFQYIEGICERCGFEERLEMYNGRALCFDCREEEEGK